MKNLLLILSSILISLILIEGLARLHGGYEDYLSELNDWNRSMKRQFSMPAPNEAKAGGNNFKIVAIGDSFTFGQGISDVNKIWPAILQSCLRGLPDIKGRGIDIDVVNLGHNGGAFKLEKSLLAKYAKENPVIDLVVHQVFLNDYLTNNVDGIPSFGGSLGSEPPAESGLFFHAWFYWKKFTFVHVAKTENLTKWIKLWEGKELKHWVKDNEDFSSLVKTVDEIGARLFSFLLPSNVWDGKGYAYRTFHQNIVDSARRLAGREILDISERLFERFPSGFDFWVNSFDAHPNETIHEAYGNIMCEVLAPAIIERLAK